MSCTCCASTQPVDLCAANEEQLVAAYRQMLMDLFPRGSAWSRSSDGMVYQISHGAAGGFAKVHDRACSALREAWPCTAEETLGRWERILGLTDSCITPGIEALLGCSDAEAESDLIRRKRRVCAHWNQVFGDAPDLAALAADFGISIVPLAFCLGAGGQQVGAHNYSGVTAGQPNQCQRFFPQTVGMDDFRTQWAEDLIDHAQVGCGQVGHAAVYGQGAPTIGEYPDLDGRSQPMVDLYYVTHAGDELLAQAGCAQAGAPLGVALDAAAFMCAVKKITRADRITAFVTD